MGPCVESGLEDWRAELPALLEGQNQLSLALPAGLLRFSRVVLRRSHVRSLWDRSFGPPGSSTWFRSCSEIFKKKMNYLIVRSQKTWVVHNESEELRALLILNAA